MNINTARCRAACVKRMGLLERRFSTNVIFDPFAPGIRPQIGLKLFHLDCVDELDDSTASNTEDVDELLG